MEGRRPATSLQWYMRRVGSAPTSRWLTVSRKHQCEMPSATSSRTGVVLVKEDLKLAGWAKVLKGDTTAAAFWRAAVYSLRPLNPLGVFGKSDLVTAANTCWLAWHYVQTVLTTAFIFLFLLAIRRRFRMR